MKLQIFLKIILTLSLTILLTPSKCKTSSSIKNQRHKSKYSNSNSDEFLDDSSSSSLLDTEVDLSLSENSRIVPTAAASSSIQCETIESNIIGYCSKMGYSTMRLPNFFQDKTQIEASDRLLRYEELIKSKCSPQISTYVCGLIAPFCLQGEAMKRFEVYPCRPWCRQVKHDCQFELDRTRRLTGLKEVDGFDCVQLPFEVNGGNDTNSGPCHEGTPPQQQQQQHEHNHQQQQYQNQAKQQHTHSHQAYSPYQPYQPALDNRNYPPFITDTTQLDAGVLNPYRRPPTTSIDQQQQSSSSSSSSNNFELPTSYNNNNINNNNNNNMDNNKQLQASPTNRLIGSQLDQNNDNSTTIGQRANIDVVQQNDNSNSVKQYKATAMSILSQIGGFIQASFWMLIRYSNYLSIITVLVLIIAMNSKRLRRLKPYLTLNGSPGSNSSSSSKSSGFSQSSQRRLHQSPSSSSRSLMLIASATTGKQPQQVTHKILEQPPSQNLIQAALTQRTHINVNNNNSHANFNNNNAVELDGGQVKHRLNHERYQAHMQSLNGKQRLQAGFINDHHHLDVSEKLDSQSIGCNQYDYIQMPMNGHQHQHNRQQIKNLHNINNNQHHQQLYSNILLSSPSHQVLLYGGSGSASTQQQQPTRAPYYTSTATASPYAASPAIGRHQVVEPPQFGQHSFQRRLCRPGGGMSLSSQGGGSGGANGGESSSSDSVGGGISCSPPDLGGHVGKLRSSVRR